MKIFIIVLILVVIIFIILSLRKTKADVEWDEGVIENDPILMDDSEPSYKEPMSNRQKKSRNKNRQQKASRRKNRRK